MLDVKPLMRSRNTLPFRVTSGALSHIRAWSHPKRSLRATLTFGYAEQEYDERGQLISKFDGEHLIVGYHTPRQVANWPRFEIGGHRIAICPDAVAALKGKTLRLRKKSGHREVCPYVVVAT